MDTSEDQHLTCVDCGEEFLFTAGEQAFYRDHGLTHAPNRCKRCREARKSQRPTGGGSSHERGSHERGSRERGSHERSSRGRGNYGDAYGSGSYGGGYSGGSRGAPREMHPTVCSECGTQTQVPLAPSGAPPVVLWDCLP